MDKGVLYLIPVVIADEANSTIPEQVRSTIKKLDSFLVENLRTARRYISSLKLDITIEELEFRELNKNTSDTEVYQLMQPLLQGKCIGVLSESGCPGVADPGAKAVSFAHKHKVQVVPLVGPSSILLALMASGLNGQKFSFHGYLPIKTTELRPVIQDLELSSSHKGFAHIFIEAPYRNQQLFKNLLQIAHGETLLCVARDLTGREEFVRTMPIRKWKEENIKLHKIPTIFILQTPA